MNSKNQYDNEFWEDNDNDSFQSIYIQDKHYHKLVYPVEKYFNEKRNKWMKHKTTKCYSSGDTDTFIRDALTGNYYNVKVGSKEEELFFKVRLCHKKFNFPVTVFYSNPEEYEREHYTVLKNETKFNWQQKYNNYLNTHKQ